MIIANGYIRFKSKTAGGIDPNTGFPVKSESSFGRNVPCQYRANSMDKLGRVKGEHFVRAQYTILIEHPEPVASEQLQLFDSNGTFIREFSIISVEALDAVCQTRILV